MFTEALDIKKIQLTSPLSGVYGLIGAVGYIIFKCGNEAFSRNISTHSFENCPVPPSLKVISV